MRAASVEGEKRTKGGMRRSATDWGKKVAYSKKKAFSIPLARQWGVMRGGKRSCCVLVLEKKVLLYAVRKGTLLQWGEGREGRARAKREVSKKSTRSPKRREGITLSAKGKGLSLTGTHASRKEEKKGRLLAWKRSRGRHKTGKKRKLIYLANQKGSTHMSVFKVVDS